MSTALHWAAAYLGQPWTPPGSAGWTCWTFARHVQAEHYGQALPPYGGESFITALDFARAIGWRCVCRWQPSIGECLPDVCDGDLLLLRTGDRLHAGTVVQADGRYGLLHANGTLERGVPVGEVIWEPLSVAVAGYQRAELWRHHAR